MTQENNYIDTNRHIQVSLRISQPRHEVSAVTTNKPLRTWRTTVGLSPCGWWPLKTLARERVHSRERTQQYGNKFSISINMYHGKQTCKGVILWLNDVESFHAYHTIWEHCAALPCNCWCGHIGAIYLLGVWRDAPLTLFIYNIKKIYIYTYAWSDDEGRLFVELKNGKVSLCWAL